MSKFKLKWLAIFVFLWLSAIGMLIWALEDGGFIALALGVINITLTSCYLVLVASDDV